MGQISMAFSEYLNFMYNSRDKTVFISAFPNLTDIMAWRLSVRKDKLRPTAVELPPQGISLCKCRGRIGYLPHSMQKSTFIRIKTAAVKVLT